MVLPISGYSIMKKKITEPLKFVKGIWWVLQFGSLMFLLMCEGKLFKDFLSELCCKKCFPDIGSYKNAYEIMYLLQNEENGMVAK